MNKSRCLIQRMTCLAVALVLCASPMWARQAAGGALRGQVTDPHGAVIVGTTVKLISDQGVEKTTQTNEQGRYAFNNLASGTYTLYVIAEGFSVYEAHPITIAQGQQLQHDVQLTVSAGKQTVKIEANGATLSADPENNASAIVLNTTSSIFCKLLILREGRLDNADPVFALTGRKYLKNKPASLACPDPGPAIQVSKSRIDEVVLGVFLICYGRTGRVYSFSANCRKLLPDLSAESLILRGHIWRMNRPWT